MAVTFALACARCEKDYKFTEDQMKEQLNKTIKRLGAFKILASVDQELDWVCDGCLEAKPH